MSIPMIFHWQFGFSQFISFREEDLWNFSQSEHIIGPGSHIEYPTGTKNSYGFGMETYTVSPLSRFTAHLLPVYSAT
jgi:hypothetical protein